MTDKILKKDKLPTISIHGKPYTLVKDRILRFHELYPNGRIVCEATVGTESVVSKAVIHPDVSNLERFFTGHSEAYRGTQGITGQSPVEVSETSAVGRALGMMGIGIIEGVASADEVTYAERVSQTGIKKTCQSCGIEFSVPASQIWKKICVNCYRTNKAIAPKSEEEKVLTMDEVNQAIQG